MSDMEVIVEPGKQDVVFKRSFDAPRDIVYRALTDPKLIANWWGPRKYETIVDKMDAAAGRRVALHQPQPGNGEEFASTASITR